MSDNNSNDKKSDSIVKSEQKKIKKKDNERAESSSDAIARAAAASLRTSRPKGIEDSSIGKHRTPQHIRDSDFYKQYMRDKYPHADNDNSMDGRDHRRKWFPTSKAAKAHQNALLHREMMLKTHPHVFDDKEGQPLRRYDIGLNLDYLEENQLPFEKGMKHPSVPDFNYGTEEDRIRWEAHNRLKYNVHDTADSLGDFGAAEYAKKLIPYKKHISSRFDENSDTASLKSSKTTRARKNPEADSDTDSSLTSNTILGRYIDDTMAKNPDVKNLPKIKKRYQRIRRGENLVKNTGSDMSENSAVDYNKFIKIPPEKDKTKYPKMMLMKRENPWLFQFYDPTRQKKRVFDGSFTYGAFPADKEKFMEMHNYYKKQGLLPENLAKKFDNDFTKSMSQLKLSEKNSDKKSSEKDDSTWYKSIHSKDFSNSAERSSKKNTEPQLSEMYEWEDELQEAEEAFDKGEISKLQFKSIKQRYDEDMDRLGNYKRSRVRANFKRFEQMKHLGGMLTSKRRDLNPNDKFKPIGIKAFDHVEYPELEKKYGNGQLDSNIYKHLRPKTVKNILNFGKQEPIVNAKKIRNNLMKEEDRDIFNYLKPLIDHNIKKEPIRKVITDMRIDDPNWDGRVTRSASKLQSTEKSSSTGTKTVKGFNPDWNKDKNLSEVTRYSQVPSITSSRVSSVSTGTDKTLRKIDKTLQANGKLRLKQFMGYYTDALTKNPTTKSELSELKRDNLEQNFEKKRPTQQERADFLKKKYIKWRYENRPDPPLPGQITPYSTASDLTSYNSHRSFSDRRSTKSAESSAKSNSSSESSKSAISLAKTRSTLTNNSSMSSSSKSDTNSMKRTLSQDSNESSKTVKPKKKFKK